MTKFLKGSALIACLLSSFAMTAIAGPEHVANDLFERIMKKKDSSNADDKREGENAEKWICSKLPQHCEGMKLTNHDVGRDLNKDKSEEAKSLVKKLILINGLSDR
jgi:hypothetical protein